MRRKVLVYVKSRGAALIRDAATNREFMVNMVEDIDPHIIGITETWANKDISDAELGRKDTYCLGEIKYEELAGEVFIY